MTTGTGRSVHVVTLECKDAENAARCLGALAAYGRPDAEAFGCVSYDFGLKEGTEDTVHLVERWNGWDDLDALLAEKVVPALPLYNEMLRRPFDPATDTMRIRLT
ncbi:hypothetical protein OEZ60_01025 [Defluviimonas sp. WL0024]|uniref:Antibiotic biosynthesis monooxygenase n=2 Tax=Albidovulum TaxID=205889 RepID=A0ABT3IY86_9RHOB|nr:MULTISPECIES: hypothetical protein [Defluviimonas]MCU9846587.1 hypothetical protein [Defluviimonas sp. WL0024]MCW3780159.1 hypothetical protein [Defluviimonas salinarum]